MAYEHKDGFGNLFKNKAKEAGSNHPDYKGEVMVGGQLWEIAGWIKTGPKGSYMSLKVQEPRQRPVEKLDGKRAGDVQDLASDIPF